MGTVESMDEARKAIEQYVVNVSRGVPFRIRIINTTRVFFADSMFAWTYHEGPPGDTISGKTFPANDTFYYDFNLRGHVIEIGGALMWKVKKGNKWEWRHLALGVKKASPGKYFTRVGWKIRYGRTFEDIEVEEVEVVEEGENGR